MNNLKHQTLYNTMYFDESASRAYDRNREFWIELNNLCRKHPETTVTVEHLVIKDRYVSHLLEDVRVKYNHEELQNICDQIYRSLY
ncbi:hypothetical protein [Bacteroides hominis]